MAGKRIKPFNENYFQTLTPESAYWLGFIQADGNVSSERHVLSIEIHSRDKYLLEMFAEDIGAETHNITLNKRNHARLRLWSKRMHADLIALGILPRKSFTGSYPIIEDRTLFKHYIRGVFDGDGSIMMKKRKDRSPRPRAVILGSKSFCDWAFPLIQKCANINVGGVYALSTIYGVTFEGYPSVEKFYSWLYEDSNGLCLERKKQRFEESFLVRAS
ncbi:hypothetical protein [Paenibacillus naphthalenovorans]|uniref:hypothetical protein n=1 Tax=Paenibacillus naphthalenovorans TaxID=162209 RepID=UPI003D2E75C2